MNIHKRATGAKHVTGDNRAWPARRRAMGLLVLTVGVLFGVRCGASAGEPGRGVGRPVLGGAQHLAMQGNGGSIPPCASCHGLLGEGNADQAVPRLAALPEAYLLRQLNGLANGARTSPIMTPIARGLSGQEAAGLAAFYARRRVASASADVGRSRGNDTGRQLALRGRGSDDLPGCVHCHGGEGSGVGANFPPLAGQPASYIANQLRAWQNNQRDPGPLGLMGGIANKLSAADVAAVAAYFGGADAAGAARREPAGAGAGVTAASPVHGVPPTHPGIFLPPDEATIPDNAFGNMVRLGERIFDDTRRYAAAYVGNDLHCSHCHLDAGRKADSAPLWAAYVSYPAYREKNHRVMTFDERMQDCFRFSMNGRAPPLGSPTLVALDAYAYWLAGGAVVSPKLPGRGYPTVPVPVSTDFEHGRQIYAQRCALCHGANGVGQKAADGEAVFPALWGSNSFNWGAGMANISKAAGFVRANMPLSQPNTLSDRDAYDVAAYIDAQERPQDPRYTVSVAQTRARYHDSADSLYGRRVGGHVLGSRQAGGSR